MEELVLGRRPAVELVENDGPACSPGLWDRSIPREILLKIFRHAVDEVGAVPFLVTMSEVCLSWKSVAQDVSLWEKVDLSDSKVTEAQLNEWSNSGMLKRVRELHLSYFGRKLSQSTIVNLVKNGPRLEFLNLSHNPKLAQETMEFIIDNCENLRGINISGTKNWGASVCDLRILELLFRKRGSRLVQFCIAGNGMPYPELVLDLISSHLPTLEVLDFSYVTKWTLKNYLSTSVFYFPLEKIQESCPELRVLRLANTQTRLATVTPTDRARSPGFRKLEELSVNGLSSLKDTGLERILKTSERLTHLDVRECQCLSLSGLVKIPARDLTHLYLGLCSAAIVPNVELIMKKWSHSLRVIHMSWVSREDAVNAALRAVATYLDRPSQLYEIDIEHTFVSFETLKLVLEECVRLKKLDLSYYRGLPQDIRRLFEALSEAWSNF